MSAGNVKNTDWQWVFCGVFLGGWGCNHWLNEETRVFWCQYMHFNANLSCSQYLHVSVQTSQGRSVREWPSEKPKHCHYSFKNAFHGFPFSFRPLSYFAPHHAFARMQSTRVEFILIMRGICRFILHLFCLGPFFEITCSQHLPLLFLLLESEL